MRDAAKKLTMADVKKEFGIELDSSGNLCQFGGIRPFIKLLEKAQIKQRLTETVGADQARVMLQMMIGIICGADSMEEIEKVGQDNAIKPYLVRPLSATRIPRVLSQMSPSKIQNLHEFVTSLSLLDLATFMPQGGFLDVDVDATSVEKYGKQEGVESGYVDKDIIEKCYQYLLFRFHQTNTIFYGTIRAGSAHSQNGIMGYLNQFLPTFANTNWRLRLRLDSGFYNEEVMDICTANKAFIFVKAPMSSSRKSQAESPKIQWIPDEKDPSVAWGEYQTVTKSGAIYREVFKRIEVVDDSFFPYFKYYCVVTNDLDMPLTMVFAQYNGRANIENSIRELKYDYHLGRIITKSFDVNDIITQVTLMAHILIQHFKRLVLDKKDHKSQLATLRWKFLNLPTFALRGARRQWYRITNAFMDGKYFIRMLYRLKTKVSFLCHPPTLLLN